MTKIAKSSSRWLQFTNLMTLSMRGYTLWFTSLWSIRMRSVCAFSPKRWCCENVDFGHNFWLLSKPNYFHQKMNIINNRLDFGDGDEAYEAVHYTSHNHKLTARPNTHDIVTYWYHIVWHDDAITANTVWRASPECHVSCAWKRLTAYVRRQREM